MAERHSTTSMSTLVDPRPVSYAATQALSIATEAMRNAAELMSKATEALFAEADSSWSPRASLSRPLTSVSEIPDIPLRRSSIGQVSIAVPVPIEKPSLVHIKTDRSTSPEDRNYRRQSRQSTGVCHIDLLEAVSKLKASKELKEEKEYMSPRRSYGEDVADRNMSGMYSYVDTPTSSQLEPINPRTPSPPPHGHPAVHMSTGREVFFISTICLSHFLMQASLSLTIAPLNLISATFHPSGTTSSSLAWYAAAYALTVGTFILPSGRLGDVYGHKRIFVVGWFWFSAFSVLAGFSSKIAETGADGEVFLVFCRAMQGIGPALLMPNALALLGTTYPPGNKKNMVFALFGACAPAGFVIGAAFSSLLAQKLHWSWGFWILGMVCATVGLLCMLVIPSPAADAANHMGVHDVPIQTRQIGFFARLKERFVRSWTLLDGSGSCLGVTALILINVSLNQAPLVSWSTPYTYFILIIGVLFLTAFFIVQSHVAHPLISHEILNRDTLVVLVCMACGWACMGIWLFYTWSFMENLKNLSPLTGSAWYAPAPIAGLVAGAATGILLSKLHPRWLMLISMFAFFGGTTVMATTEVSTVYWLGVFWSVVIMPFGMDMSFPSATILLSDRAGKGSQGMAASLVNTVVNYGISIGLGLAGSLERGVAGDLNRVLDDATRLKGHRSAWYLGMGLSGLGILVSLTFVVVHVVGERRSRGMKSRGNQYGHP